jgi:hypothetical protein
MNSVQTVVFGIAGKYYGMSGKSACRFPVENPAEFFFFFQLKV